jgi:hypothetical protein
MGAAFPAPPSEPPTSPGGGIILGEELPAQRPVVDEGGTYPTTDFEHATAYQKEHDLKMLHKLLMRGMRLELCARSLNKTLDETARMRRTIWRRLRVEAENLDMLTHAGRTLAYYDDVRAQALRTASDPAVSVVSRMRALEVSLKAEGDKHSFLYRAGFYSATKFTPKADVENDGARDASLIARMAQAIIDPTMDDDMVRDLMDQVARSRETTDDEAQNLDVNML